MPEMPPEAVTEEQYTDEHGHIVVKKVPSDCILCFLKGEGITCISIVIQ